MGGVSTWGLNEVREGGVMRAGQEECGKGSGAETSGERYDWGSIRKTGQRETETETDRQTDRERERERERESEREK